MHSDYTAEGQGKCPRCGMALVHASPFDVRDYRLDFHTVPAVVRPGRRASLRFRIMPSRHRRGRRRSSKLVHERQYHLFLISQDMEYFQHIHPQRAGRRHVDDRRHAAEGRLLQGAVGFSAERRLVAVHRAAARHRRIPGRSRSATARILSPTRSLTKDRRRHHRNGHLRSAAVRRRPVRPHHVSPHGHSDRQADHRSADLSRRLRPHAHHERRHGGVRPLASARHPREAGRRRRAAGVS